MAKRTPKAKMQVTVHEAKTHLSRLLRRVGEGEEIIIARGKEPVARLVPIEPPPQAQVLGSAKGQVWMSDDFNGPLPADLQAAFDGEE